jgi:hypothetical protein
MGSSGVADHSISWFNELNTREAVDAIRSCCQSAQFAALVASARPFGKLVDLVQHTRNVWWTQVRNPSVYVTVLNWCMSGHEWCLCSFIAEVTGTFLHVNSVVRDVLLAVSRRASW